MKKYLISLIFTITFAKAGLINAIALLVNNQPITLYDIDTKMETLHISKAKAVGLLIDEVLYKQLLIKYDIEVDSFDLENYMQKLAQNNHMSLFEFKNAVKQQQNYEKFKLQLKDQLKHQKLISKIASNKLTIATDDDLKIYYNNHQSLFQIANSIDVIQYSSKQKQLLKKFKHNPMMMDKNVVVKNLTLKQKDLEPQVKFIVNKTKEKQFSAIFIANKSYNMFYIVKKSDIQYIKFADVKNKIFQIVMKQREDDYLKNYFENLKLTANIKILR